MPARDLRNMRPRRRRTAPVGPVVAAVMAIAVLLALFGPARCLSSSPSAAEGGSGGLSELPRNQYRWTGLERTNDRLAYTGDGRAPLPCGCRCFQQSGRGGLERGCQRRHRVRLHSPGVSRNGYGRHDDRRELREANRQGARAAGLDRGAYYFSQAVSVEEAREEAQAVIDQLGGRPLQLPVVFDSATSAAGTGVSRTADLDSQQISDIALAFCERIEAAGYRPMVYGNASDLGRYDLL